MENYNPRQPTRFRFKDSREMEKFTFISGNFNFQNEERYENVSKTYPFNKIVSVFKKVKRKKQKQPIILYDTTGSDVFVGVAKEDSINCYYLSEITSPAWFQLEYNEEEDIIDCYVTLDTNVTEDNLKTLFGNQSIVGTGNIDLYNHQLLINDDCYFNIISSNNLVIDSIQDLTNVLKPTTKNIYYFGFQKATLNTASLEYDKTTNTWKYRSDGTELALVSKVSDIVTTI